MNQYINHNTLKPYNANRKADWRDIPGTSEQPSPHHKPVVEDGAHVGWEFDKAAWRAAEVPASITLRQLRAGLVLAEWITREEAVAWRKNEVLPPPVQAVIDALPEEQQFIAEETAFSMSVALRDDPLLKAAAQAAMPDASDEEVEAALDEAFIAWSDL